MEGRKKMKAIELLDIISMGETSRVQFKIVYVDEGVSKPYKDRNGAIWIKQGSDKRKVTDNADILRLFQQSGGVYVDEMPMANTNENDIDKEKVAEYVKRLQREPAEIERIPALQLYRNLKILKDNQLTLGGLLFFAKGCFSLKPISGIFRRGKILIPRGNLKFPKLR
jgi:predicted HTH transcriptional regulator